MVNVHGALLVLPLIWRTGIRDHILRTLGLETMIRILLCPQWHIETLLFHTLHEKLTLL